MPPKTSAPDTVIYLFYFYLQSYLKTMCDYLWHCLTSASRLLVSSLSPLAPSRRRLSFFLSRSNQKAEARAESSEQITSHSLWMFEDDGGTAATREEMHSDCCLSWSQPDNAPPPLPTPRLLHQLSLWALCVLYVKTHSGFQSIDWAERQSLVLIIVHQIVAFPNEMFWALANPTMTRTLTLSLSLSLSLSNGMNIGF